MRTIALLPAALLALLPTTLALEPPTPPRPTITTTPSNLTIEHLAGPSTCTRPSRNKDTLSMHYKGTLLSDGTVFDTSYKRNKPFKFLLGAGHVIAGWDEGMLDMCVGEERKLTIPPELGYGERGAGSDIPPNAWLVFEAKLMGIVGVPEANEVAQTSTTAAEVVGATETAAVAASKDKDKDKDGGDKDDDETPKEPAQCHLLGPYALFAQGGLGALAVLSLVWKRYHETPKRPWKIFFFDVSKQVFGSMLTHVINLGMSIVGSGDFAAQAVEAAKTGGDGKSPNPCSFYLLNLGIDTTLGVPVLYILLKILPALFAYTPLANPPQSIKSGVYGTPPQVTWYFKQLLIYCIGLIGMKIFVFFLFMAMPFLPWIGDWALRWTEGSEALQVAFALFLFPLIMNAVQYWIVDSFIMASTKEGEKESGGVYERVGAGEDEEDDEERGLMGGREVGKGGVEEEEEESRPALTEIQPTPVEEYRDAGSSSGSSPPKVVKQRKE
ncbi:unnamed protein product [Zymoseptoria tritici ST99CH_3D7]|uniref:peptidylprolyl isomerase n=1 Tax=Zymoseptoria tritici (strain ST99CH_3D7) TaxID=1276538 RepID=A0A1X7RWP7_ZYMT9|nr:unnamed protein product [Zymoseptoria tritici ST99CH_3D7]